MRLKLLMLTICVHSLLIGMDPKQKNAADFIEAVGKGDSRKALALLKNVNQIDPVYRGTDGMTPLMAYLDGFTRLKFAPDMLRQAIDALSQGVLNAENDNGVTALMVASRNGNLPAVQILFDKRADVSMQSQGKTALDMARDGYRAETNDQKIEDYQNIIKILDGTTTRLNNGQKLLKALEEKDFNASLGLLKLPDDKIDLTVKDAAGAGSLHWAIDGFSDNQNQLKQIFDLIFKRPIGKRSGINEEDNNKNTPLSDAIKNKSEFAVKYLLEKGADAKRDFQGKPLIEYAKQFRDAGPTQATISIYKMIESAIGIEPIPVPVPVDRTPDEYAQDLIKAIMDNDNNKIVELLGLPAGKINGNYRGRKGNGILVEYVGRIASSQNLNAIKYFIDTLITKFGADINLENDQGITPLMGAAITKTENGARYLIDAGADVNKVATSGDYRGMTALQIANKLEKETKNLAEQIIFNRIVKILLEKAPAPQPTPEPEPIPVPSGDAQRNAKVLYDAIRTKNRDAFMNAFNVEPIDMSFKGTYGLTPFAAYIFYFAESVPSLETVKKDIDLFLGKKANLNAADEEGDTPLIMAVKQGLLGVAQYLVEKGADSRVINTENETALTLAQKAYATAAGSKKQDYGTIIQKLGGTLPQPMPQPTPTPSPMPGPISMVSLVNSMQKLLDQLTQLTTTLQGMQK